MTILHLHNNKGEWGLIMIDHVAYRGLNNLTLDQEGQVIEGHTKKESLYSPRNI